jgi:hypothetical protein
MKHPLSKWAVFVAGSVAIGILFSGCAWSIGDGKGHSTSVVQPTRGQELIDLRKARDQGAISEDEYQAQKKAIMTK